MASASSLSIVQKAYVAFYGRPADHSGQQFWAEVLEQNGGNLASIIDAFGASAESTALYGSGSTLQRVEKIYQQLFNREAEEAGKQWWAEQIDAGHVSLQSAALSILNGATSGDDLIIVNKKVEAAALATTQMESKGLSASYDERDIDAARSFLSSIGKESSAAQISSAVTGFLGKVEATSPITPLPSLYDDRQVDSSGQLSKLTKISFDTHVEGVLGLRYNQDGQIYKDIVDGYTFVAPSDGVLQMDFYGDPTIYVRVLGLFDNYVSKAVYRGPAEDYHYQATASVFAGEQVTIQLSGGELNAAGQGSYYSFDFAMI
ncbi:DUF4214 domain-containing protein [Pseudomonas sp. NY15367]